MMLLRCISAHRSGCVGLFLSVRGFQSCFDVGKLSVCGTAQRWMFDRRSAEHFSQSRSFSTLLQHESTSPVQLNVRLSQPLFTVVRFRRRKMSRKSDDSPASAEDEVNCLVFIVWQVLCSHCVQSSDFCIVSE